ncbi:MAG: hypothetical protein V7637_1116 [Mycobacteriales bacterium]
MVMATKQARALVDELCGLPDEAAVRTVDVLHAHAAALAWVGETTGSRPVPKRVAARLEAAAALLRSGTDSRDPAAVLIGEAVAALAEGSSSAA